MNGECWENKCDCIRDGVGKCIASPPQLCSPDGVDVCENGQICNPDYDACLCPEAMALIGTKCVETFAPDWGGGIFFERKCQNMDVLDISSM